ncbi:hypothetical protein ABVK25_007471 [Lepraria finkii]|uniref:Protein kinase domain-containing protein n=1 Tax=Lepraria finkii TaxID=1340010 RepID=A0ABR4B326_9LECA
MQTTSRAGQDLGKSDGANVIWNPYTRTLDTTPINGSGSGGEGQASKRSPNGATPARPAEPTPSVGMRADPYPPPTTRRGRDQTFRDQRAALPNSTSLQASPSKRLAYNGFSNPQTSKPTFTPSSSQEPHSRPTSFGHSSRFSFSSAAPIGRRDVSNESESFDFLPPINFDDFHASIVSGDPDINSFPKPGGSLAGTANGSNSILQRPGMNGPSKKIDSSQLSSRIGLNGSSVRRHDSTVGQAGQARTEIGTMAPPEASASARARRKTYFATPSSGSAVPRAPRKSVGPGILTLDLTGPSQTHRRPSLAQTGFGEIAKSSDATDFTAIRNVSGTQAGNFESSNRHNKSKSLQPPPRKIATREEFSTPMGTPEETFHSPISTTHSPARPRLQRTTTPSSSKRVSMMPNSAHATGLAARTISPTDARRLKRMSMMPNPPPMPFTPPTPQPDPLHSVVHPSVPSPSMIPRKSVTPSSSRTTPDLNRKSYSSGVSNSSTTSYSSFLASTGSLRISQSFSTSRLPTLKTRNDNASLGDDELVPPVPAIPKAYESPKTEDDQPPFFSARKSSMAEVNSLNSISTSADLPSPLDPELPKPERQSRPKKNIGSEQEPIRERKPSGGVNTNRRTLQPLRLPPLNLLPLSTPTASKIAALYDCSITNTKTGAATPPPKDGSKGTPTTPMTASKASFSSNYYEDDHAPMSAQVRSSSSHYNIRPEALSCRAASSSGTAAPTPQDSYALTASRTAMSPFVSSSLPKPSVEYGYSLEKSNTLDSADAKPTKVKGPRLQKPRNVSKDDTSSLDTPSSVDASTPSMGNSIRRKLSLTRRRSNSKAQKAAERDAEPQPKPPKHDNMPPPRLPASATWNGPLLTSPSPSQQQNQSRPNRNTPNSSGKVQHDRTRSSNWDAVETSKEDCAFPGSKRTARANLEGAPSQNAMSLKDFLKEAKTIEAQLDRDDLSAEEEMKRLASKRKETESAAKEVDALRRRATAKERVSPGSALRMASLNIFERGEIVDYKDIYFCGTQGAKKHVGDLSTEVANFGYDDERGDYNIVTGDHLAYRYEIVDILGKGSFGQVIRCVDHKTGGLVAIKIIRNKKRFHQQALVEVEILQKLREWDPQNKHSMVSFTQSFYFRGHLCISTELLGMNLYEFIKCHDFRGFSLKLIRRFAKQMLSSLVLLKRKKVIHCDLKPENILLAHPASSEIKVIDFGSSCLENEKVYTYIQSRFYRSPEVILGMTYGMPIDMWSLGCILAELLTGYPIFPGENEQEQLACIMEVFGPPEKHLIEKSTRKKLFFDSLGKPRITVSTKGKRRRPSSKSLQQALKCEDEAFLDFITRCLRWDPDRRLKPDEATHHEFITGKSSKSAATRPRTTLSNPTNSPIKRYNSISQTPAGTRPLPDPPTTSFKNGAAVRTRDVSTASQSPSKAATSIVGPKRHSTVTGIQPNNNPAGIKRTMNGVVVQGSALPRITSTPKVSKDLAAAAAAASLAHKSSR